MSDNKITQDQLEPNVMEELESGIGDLSTLSTENKDSLVAAVTEIYGKNVIAEAIGEPLAVTDTFSEMGSEINGLLSTFKTNMMNSGVTVESGDKFKQLIDKIKGLTEGEGNKGIQYASLTTDIPITNSEYNSVSFTLDFVPSLIFITIDNMNIEYPENYRFNAKQNKGVVNNIHHTSMDTCLEIENTIIYGSSTIYSPKTYYYITANDQLFNFHYMNNAPNIFNKMSVTYYAIGVGEEDTTLRDSLASILEEKGVDVTEEDDMASLITKIENMNFITIKSISPGTSYLIKDSTLNTIVTTGTDFYKIDEYTYGFINGEVSLSLSIACIGGVEYDDEFNQYYTDSTTYLLVKHIRNDIVIYTNEYQTQGHSGSVYWKDYNFSETINLEKGDKLEFYVKGVRQSTSTSGCKYNGFKISCDLVFG